jgi:hypothetical protein
LPEVSVHGTGCFRKSPIGWAETAVIGEQLVLTNAPCAARRPLRAGSEAAVSLTSFQGRIMISARPLQSRTGLFARIMRNACDRKSQARGLALDNTYHTGMAVPETRIGRHNLNQTIQQGN